MIIVLIVDVINFLKECIVNGVNYRFWEFLIKYRNIGYVKKIKFGWIILLYSKVCGFFLFLLLNIIVNC